MSIFAFSCSKNISKNTSQIFRLEGGPKKKTTTLFDINQWVFIGETPILHTWNGNFVSFPTVCVDFFYLKNSRSYGELKIARKFSKNQILSIFAFSCSKNIRKNKSQVFNFRTIHSKVCILYTFEIMITRIEASITEIFVKTKIWSIFWHKILRTETISKLTKFVF